MANQTQVAYYKEMAKLQKQIGELKKCINRNVSEIYACFVLVLTNKGYSPEDIEEIFNETLTTWNENVERMDTIIEWCEKETGICVQTLGE